MKSVVRFLVEMLGLFVLGAGMLFVVILAAKRISDEKLQYFVIGYYVAIHHDLVLWIWKKIGIEKAAAHSDRDLSGMIEKTR